MQQALDADRVLHEAFEMRLGQVKAQGDAAQKLLGQRHHPFVVTVDQVAELRKGRGPLVRAEERPQKRGAFRSDVETFLQVARLAGIGILAERFDIAAQRNVRVRHMQRHLVRHRHVEKAAGDVKDIIHKGLRDAVVFHIHEARVRQRPADLFRDRHLVGAVQKGGHVNDGDLVEILARVAPFVVEAGDQVLAHANGSLAWRGGDVKGQRPDRWSGDTCRERVGSGDQAACGVSTTCRPSRPCGGP